MNTYIVFSFIIFLIVDYVYIYGVLDNKILFTKSGSKLSSLTGNKKIKYSITGEKLLVIWISTLCMFAINFCITIYAINSNFLNIDILDFNLNFSAILGEKYVFFKVIYYIASLIFFCLISIRYSEELMKIFLKLKNKGKYDISSVPGAGEKLITIGALYNGEDVTIKKQSLYQNILITGSIGSGKTSGAICNITNSLIKEEMGGLILDAKGNFVDHVKVMCKRAGRLQDLRIISLNSNCYFELLEKNISAHELANRLRHVIELLSPNNNSDTYFIDKVENVLLNLIIILDYLDKREIIHLHKSVTSKEYLIQLITECKEKTNKVIPDNKTCFNLSNAILFVKEEYLNLEPRIYSILTSEITRLTIPLVTDYDVYNQFGQNTNNRKQISFDNNNIVVLSINIGENAALCKIIAVFLKLSFQKYILSTLKNKKTFPSFFISDEFQEFVNKDDSSFFSLSREAKCINMISTQSYTSLKSSLNNVDSALVILQNFVNKIWFRNDDNFTNTEVVKQLGKTERQKENISISENAQESKFNILRGGFKNRKSSISNAINYVTTKENEYDENVFTRELQTFEAIIFAIDLKDKIIPKKIKFNIWR